MSKDPDFIRMSPLERVMFGFNAEIETNPQRFFTIEYVNGIIQQEQLANDRIGRVFLSLMLLNTLAVAYVQGAIKNLHVFGMDFQNLPGVGVGTSLFLGLAIFAFTTNMLDVLLLSRIRWLVIHKAIGTDLVAMATAHLKGNNLWSDLWTARMVGYASTPAHQRLSLWYAFALLGFFGAVVAASLASLIGVVVFNLNNQPYAAGVVVSCAGLFIGLLGVSNFVVGIFAPFKFVRPEQPSSAPHPEIVTGLPSQPDPKT